MIRSSKKLVVRLSKLGLPYHCWIKSPPSNSGVYIVEEVEDESGRGYVYLLYNSTRIDYFSQFDHIINLTIKERSRDIKIGRIIKS